MKGSKRTLNRGGGNKHFKGAGGYCTPQQGGAPPAALKRSKPAPLLPDFKSGSRRTLNRGRHLCISVVGTKKFLCGGNKKNGNKKKAIFFLVPTALHECEGTKKNASSHECEGSVWRVCVGQKKYWAKIRQSHECEKKSV